MRLSQSDIFETVKTLTLAKSSGTLLFQLKDKKQLKLMGQKLF